VTVTFIQRSDVRSNDFHATTAAELGFETTTAASSTLNRVPAVTTGVIAWVWTSTDVGFATWGSGTYTAQLDVTAAGASHTYGFSPLGAVTGHMGRMATGHGSEPQSVSQNEADFTGTGLKVSTFSWTGAAGATTDVLDAALALAATTMGQTMTIRLNTTDSYLGGPFDGGAAAGSVHRLLMLGVGI
jgi:hypothetical protein